MYEKVVAENVPVGTVIVRVTASDEDEPGSVNSAIEYSLDSTADGTFKIHKTLGTVAEAGMSMVVYSHLCSASKREDIEWAFSLFIIRACKANCSN